MSLGMRTGKSGYYSEQSDTRCRYAGDVSLGDLGVAEVERTVVTALDAFQIVDLLRSIALAAVPAP